MRADLLDRPSDVGLDPYPIRFAPRASVDHEMARRLRGVRRSLGASRDEVADLAGLSAARLRSYELGVTIPQPRTLIRICGALGVTATPFLLLRRQLTSTGHAAPTWSDRW